MSPGRPAVVFDVFGSYVAGNHTQPPLLDFLNLKWVK